MVRTVRRTVLRFLTDFINEMQASARTSLCRLYTDTRAHAHTRHMPPIVHSRPKASAMDATAVPRSHLFISLYLLGPTDNADPPTSPQMRPFPPRREAENIHGVSHVLLSQFFLFHRRALRFQPIRRKVRRTQRIVPRACPAKRFGPRTQLRRNSSNCTNQVCEVKVRPVKNSLTSPNFFSGSLNTSN